MKDIIVYHGGTEIVEHPICKFGRRNLDFGQGFYITDIRKQAVDWASLMADRRRLSPVLNRYRLNREAVITEACCKVFEAYHYEQPNWCHFCGIGQALEHRTCESLTTILRKPNLCRFA